jgi:hypothetical protein
MQEKRKNLTVGIVLLIIFVGVLVVLLTPVFQGKPGLVIADSFFNSLAKGSTYYIPEVKEKSEKYLGRSLDVRVEMESAEVAEKTGKLYAEAGANVKLEGNVLTISGDLGRVFEGVLSDADAMFKGEGDKVYGKYGYDEKEAMYYWHLSFEKIAHEYRMEREFETSMFIDEEVIKKGIEPAYNFYGIESKSVGDHAGILSGGLTFYVLYTLIWGFAIFFIFLARGLSMEEAEKKEY